MTSVFYEDIKLSDASILSIEKCESFSKTQKRLALDEKRKKLLANVLAKKVKLGLNTAHSK